MAIALVDPRGQPGRCRRGPRSATGQPEALDRHRRGGDAGSAGAGSNSGAELVVKTAMLTLFESDLPHRPARALLDRASAQIPRRRQGRAGRPQRRRQIDPARSDSRRFAAGGRHDRAAARLPDRISRSRGAEWSGDARSKQCLPPIASAPACWPSAKPGRRPCVPPRSKPGSSRSTLIRRRAVRRASWPGSASTTRCSAGRSTISPAAGGCAWRWRRSSSPSPTSCCSTSRPTTSTSKPRYGSNAFCASIAGP